MSPQVHCGKISERAKRALERRLRPHTTLSAHELAYTLRISESTIWSILRGSKIGPSGRVLQLLVGFFGASFLHEVFSDPNVHCFDPRDGQRSEALRIIAEAQDELRSLTNALAFGPPETLDGYLRQNVTGDVGSFVMRVRGTDDIAATYRAKFILDISMVHQ